MTAQLSSACRNQGRDEILIITVGIRYGPSLLVNPILTCSATNAASLKRLVLRCFVPRAYQSTDLLDSIIIIIIMVIVIGPKFTSTAKHRGAFFSHQKKLPLINARCASMRINVVRWLLCLPLSILEGPVSNQPPAVRPSPFMHSSIVSSDSSDVWQAMDDDRRPSCGVAGQLWVLYAIRSLN